MRVDRLSKRYGRRLALDEVGFAVRVRHRVLSPDGSRFESRGLKSRPIAGLVLMTRRIARALSGRVRPRKGDLTLRRRLIDIIDALDHEGFASWRENTALPYRDDTRSGA